jgi:hypothetical protein
MNADRLLKLANFLDNLPPERFNFRRYETGAFSEKSWKDCQRLGTPLYVQLAHIEAYARGK